MFPTLLNDAANADYKKASDLGVLVQSNLTKSSLVGKILDTDVGYVDFFNPKSSNLYTDGLKQIKDAVDFDGIMLNFVNYDNHVPGEVTQKPEPKVEEPVEKTKRFLDTVAKEEQIGNTVTYLINSNQSEISYYNVPFVPGYNMSGNLDARTISTNSSHYGNSAENVMIDYYLHNANGHQAVKTLKPVVENLISKRSIIYCDSTWAGSGQYCFPIISKLTRTWESMKNSIA